jgi:hypothetical protein
MCTNYVGLSFSQWLVSRLNGLGRWSSSGSVGLASDLRVHRIMSGGVSVISTAPSQSSVRYSLEIWLPITMFGAGK